MCVLHLHFHFHKIELFETTFPCVSIARVITYAIVRKREDRNFRFYSTNFESLGVIEASLDNLKYDKALDWTNYPLGVVWAFIEKGYPVDCGFDMLLFGNIPNHSRSDVLLYL